MEANFKWKLTSVLRVSFGPGSQLDSPPAFSDGLHKLV